jgi:hypothetical protein
MQFEKIENVVFVSAFVFLIVIFIFGALGIKVLANKQNMKLFSKYQIWVGDAAFSVGTCVNDYEIVGEFINYKRANDGSFITTPLTKVFQIEQKPCSYEIKNTNFKS